VIRNIRATAKMWTGGVGAAVVAYLGTWTDDPRVLAFPAIITAVAVYFVPNEPSP
jgi:hypothetical protein